MADKTVAQETNLPAGSINGTELIRVSQAGSNYKMTSDAFLTWIETQITATGTLWRDGSGAPSGALGANGDYYRDTDNEDIYFKAAGSWTLIGSLAGGGGGANTFTSISVATAQAGSLTDGQNYAVQDIEGLSGAIFYGVGLPDGTLSNVGLATFNGFNFNVDYNVLIDRCMWAEGDFGWKFLYSPNATNSGALSIINDWFTITPDKNLMSGCVMGGVNFTGFTFTAQSSGIVKYKDLVISETSVLDLSDVVHDCTLTGLMQSGDIVVKDAPIHYFDPNTTIAFPAYFENAHGVADLIIFSAIGTQRSTMAYAGTYKVVGLEYGSCDYDPLANTIKNSTLEVDLGTLAAAASTIDLSPVSFAGVVRATPDAGTNDIEALQNGTNGEIYLIKAVGTNGLTFNQTVSIHFREQDLSFLPPFLGNAAGEFDTITFRIAGTEQVCINFNTYQP